MKTSFKEFRQTSLKVIIEGMLMAGAKINKEEVMEISVPPIKNQGKPLLTKRPLIS